MNVINLHMHHFALKGQTYKGSFNKETFFSELKGTWTICSLSSYLWWFLYDSSPCNFYNFLFVTFWKQELHLFHSKGDARQNATCPLKLIRYKSVQDFLIESVGLDSLCCPDVRSWGLDAGPCAAVVGLGHQGVRPGGGGRHALPSAGWQSPLQDEQGGHDASHICIQRRHPALTPQLPPAE